MVRCTFLGAVILGTRLVLTTARFACADDAIANAKALANELRELQSMKKGGQTPMQQVDALADRLLKKYPETYDRRTIYYHVALVYCQSGTPYAKFMAKYSKRALDLPVDPLERLQWYTDPHFDTPYFGNPYSQRATGAVCYLEGLREAQNYHVPEAFPEPPPGVKFGDSQYAEVVKKAELWRARRQIAYALVLDYSMRPYAATELRKLATVILEDPAAVDALMKRVEEQGALEDDQPPGPFAQNKALWNELRELEPMKKGRDTPLDHVDRLADRLLKKYTSRDDRGVIYCHLALVYIQSGTPYSQFIAKYSQRALDLPVNPTLSRLRRYGELAGSLFVTRGTRLDHGYSELTEVGALQRPKIRRLAAVFILEGLRDAKKYHLPEARPEPPGGLVNLHLIGDVPSGYIWRFWKEQAGIQAATERAEARGKLWDEWRGLTGGIVANYSSPPYAASELRKLATAILEDPAAVDALMKQIEKNGALKDDPR